jgi:aminoglycoside phosphotransferase (APT) family kinase protein
MSLVDSEFSAGLAALAQRTVPGAVGMAGLKRLTAGATLQTWSFEAVDAAGKTVMPLILRRSPGGLRAGETLSLTNEAALVRQVARYGVPVAQVLHTLVDADGLGDGFVMVRLEGETIPRKLLRDAEFANARPKLVAQMGAALGAIHRVPTAGLPTMPVRSTAAMLQGMRARLDALPRASAVFEFAMRWLQSHLPADPPTLRLVHGDFRIGNLMVNADGLHAVLDWEIAHLGDPAEDLAWICLPPWRFGHITQPVAGLGQREALYSAWQAVTGEAVDPDRVRWWQVMGSLRWGVGCASMQDWFASGRDPTVERAMIARRVSENEIDLLRLLASEDAHA